METLVRLPGHSEWIAFDAKPHRVLFPLGGKTASEARVRLGLLRQYGLRPLSDYVDKSSYPITVILMEGVWIAVPCYPIDYPYDVLSVDLPMPIGCGKDPDVAAQVLQERIEADGWRFDLEESKRLGGHRE